MAKFFGAIGFSTTVEVSPGIWEEVIVERHYYGDTIKDYRKWVGSEFLNDNITISNQLSIISDPYAETNFHNMRYVEFMGVKWKIESVEISRPRLTITLGGLYNE